VAKEGPRAVPPDSASDEPKPKDESAADIDYPIAPRIPDPSKADPDDPT
jgi:hypothetical protein